MTRAQHRKTSPASAPRPMTNAEKQRAFRDRHFGVDGNRVRLQLVVDVSCAAALKRLARHRGYSVTAVVSELARQAERRVLERMTAKEERDYL